MTQIRYHNFNRPLESLPENYRILGAFHPGRISGWDEIDSFAGNNITIGHGISGVLKTNLIPTGTTGPYGLTYSKQGTFIYEDAAITISVDFAANANDRIDLLIVTHEHVESVGGTAATYSIIKGGTSGPVEPSLSNLFTQVAIGTFFIPGNVVDHVTTLYIPKRTPQVGGMLSYDMLGDGTLNSPEFNDVDDFDNMIDGGFFYTFSGTSNAPTGSGAFFLQVYDGNGSNILQHATNPANGFTYSRTSVDGGTSWNSWQLMANSGVGAFDPTEIHNMIGSSTLAGLNYSSNFFVGDGTSLETAIGALDAALNSVSVTATNALNNAATAQSTADDAEEAVGSTTGLAGMTYTSTNYISSPQNARLAIQNLDNLIRDEIIDVENAVGSSTGIAGMNYSSNFFVGDSTSAKQAIGVLDAQLNSTNTTANNANSQANTNDGRLDIIEAAYADVGANENITGVWTFDTAPVMGTVGISENGDIIKRKIIDIGDWNMDSTNTKAVSFSGFDEQDIRGIEVIIRDDPATSVFFFPYSDTSGTVLGSFQSAGSGIINLYRVTGAFFDGTQFDSTSFNRGWVLITYV